ncbi:MAG TPA: HepT-like ribonuclease domain-containing protein [Burkholderiales bacterium]|nr:HepT-like ribonuclease domain-containing protein [Burkholderiales bacterium]
MSPDDSDVAHLWDMLETAREALDYVAHEHEKTYLRDRMRQRALERTIEVLGEAAGRVSEAGRRGLPGVDWRRIIGQRIVLAHRYSKIDHALLYKTTRESVPALIDQLVALLETGDSQ